MSIASARGRRDRPGRAQALLKSAIFRYLLAVLAVAGTFGFRLWLIPMTGTGAPFVLFFAAVLAVSLFVGAGPGILAVLLSVPFAAHMFVVRAGYPVVQAGFQSLLFTVDGFFVVYLTSRIRRTRRALEYTNRHLQRANENIAGSEAAVRSLIELAPDAFFQADLDGRLVNLNAAACHLLGYERDELVGRTIFDVIPQEDAARLIAVRDKLLQPGQVDRAEWTQIRKDGTLIPVEISSNILPDGRWQVFVRDISERKRAERIQQRLARIVEDSNDAITVQDLDGNVLDWNHAAERMYGYSKAEAVRMNINVIVPEEHRQTLEYLNAMKRGETVPSAEVQRQTRDGRILDVWLTTTPLHENGRPFAVATTERDITERKRREDERQVFVSLIENSSDFIGIADPTGKPIYVNPAGRRMVGLPADYPVARTQIPEYYPEEQRSFAVDVIVKGMTERGHWSGETFFRNWKTNEAIPVSDTHFLIRDASGKRTLGMGTVTRDISEARRITRDREQLLAREQLARQEAEAASERLRESEERFRLTIDEAPIGMALVALDGRFVRVNRALCEIVGYAAGELTERTFQAITHPDDLDTDLALVGRLTRGEIPRYQLEKRYIRKDGTTVDIMLNASVLRDQDGAPLYYIAQIQDITAQKRTTDALRESENKFRTLAEALPQIVWVTRPDGWNTYFNQQWVTYTGLTLEQSYGHGWNIPFHPDDRQRAWDAWQRAVQTDGVYSLECRLRRSDGVYRWWLIRGVSLHDQRGKVISWFGTCTDVDDLKRTEAALRLARDEAEAANARLRESEKALQRAVDAREQVLGVVAHDLRNPLSTIIMQSSALERRGPEPERRNQRPKEMISRAAARMNHLIQDLLDVSLMEAGQFKLERQRLTPSDLVREAVDMQTPLASSTDIEVGLEVERDLHEVWGDRDRLHQVLENLIGNAIKFTGPGGRITIGAASRDQHVVFWVADTGCGIAPDSLPHVFDRFWQATTRARRLGAGLGLPITKGIVEAHGGRIWVESRLGGGSTFFFTIPKAAPAGDTLAVTMR